MIPAIVISFFVYEKEKDTIAAEHKQEASVLLNLHRNKINYLIGETMARMTSLSIAIDRPVDIKKMQSILEKTFDSEPRFSGLYFLNAKGDVTASTTELKTKVNLADRSFFTLWQLLHFQQLHSELTLKERLCASFFDFERTEC